VAALCLTGFIIWTGAQVPGANASREQPNATAPRPKPLPPKAGGGRLIELDADGQTKGGVATSRPRPTLLQDRVRAYGTVLSLEKLTSLYNTALTGAAQLKAAQAKLAGSRSTNERAQSLLSVFSTAKAQAEAAQAAFAVDAVGVDVAEAQMEALRNTAVQDWGPVLGAEIAARSARVSSLVLHKTMLVQLSVPLGDAVDAPGRVSIELPNGTQIEGTFLSAAPQMDPRIQNIGFLYVVTLSPTLPPGTSVLAFLPSGDSKPGVAIPPSSIVWQTGKAWIYVRTATDTFERRPLDPAAVPTKDGGYVVPSSSLPANDDVVVAGAQILLSQESRAQIPSDEDDN
jgi:hypothetical protein